MIIGSISKLTSNYMTNPLIREGNDLILKLYIQPKASRDQIIGLHNNEIKIAITAPPVDGKANSYLIKFLSKQFKVAKSQIHIEKGELGRHKQIRICQPGLIPQELIHHMNDH